MEQFDPKQNIKPHRKINKFKYLAVFAISTLIFIAGLGLGLAITHYELSGIQDIEERLRADIASAELEYVLIAENPCNPAALSVAASKLDELGQTLNYMENKLGKTNQDVLRLAEYYSLLEIRHWLLMRKVNDECSDKYDLILYFYSNIPEECADCEDQGYILSYLKKERPDVYIYSFNVGIDSSALNALKKIYGIETVPTLVINDETFVGFKTLEEIKEIID